MSLPRAKPRGPHTRPQHKPASPPALPAARPCKSCTCPRIANTAPCVKGGAALQRCDNCIASNTASAAEANRARRALPLAHPPGKPQPIHRRRKSPSRSFRIRPIATPTLVIRSSRVDAKLPPFRSTARADVPAQPQANAQAGPELLRRLAPVRRPRRHPRNRRPLRFPGPARPLRPPARLDPRPRMGNPPPAPAPALRVDGALLDNFRLAHGFWEAKDSHDDLRPRNKQVRPRLPPRQHPLPGPRRALLFQNGTLAFDADLTHPPAPHRRAQPLLQLHASPPTPRWERAVSEFQDRVPELGRSLMRDHRKGAQDQPRASSRPSPTSAALCRRSINPNLADAAVEEMLIQHLLTERLFRTIFNNPDFTRRNVIAAEIEKVIDALPRRASAGPIPAERSTASTSPSRRPPPPSPTSARSSSS